MGTTDLRVAPSSVVGLSQLSRPGEATLLLMSTVRYWTSEG